MLIYAARNKNEITKMSYEEIHAAFFYGHKMRFASIFIKYRRLRIKKEEEGHGGKTGTA